MYELYWNLKDKPFENTPDLRFLYHSQKHEEALFRLLYAIKERKAAALLTGECGSGKTLLSRVLLEEISGESYQPALIFNPKLSSIELLREILYQLGITAPSSATKTELLHQLNEILYQNKNAQKNTVIVVDEAQTIEEDGFEELRLLLNFQLNDNFLLTLILLGQPELKDKIDRLPHLKQRFSVRYHLKALSATETKEYIQRRLEVAGAEQEIFLADAYREIYHFSGGIPRRINNICDMALLVGCGEGVAKIHKDIIIKVAKDLEEIPLEANDKSEVGIDG